MEKYYKNIPCRIIAELEDNEVVIEIIEDYEDMCWDCYDSINPTTKKMIVNKNEVTDSLLTKHSIYDELIKYKKEEKEKIKKILNEEIFEIEKKRKELIEKHKNDDYIDGINYIIKSSGIDEDFNGYIMEEYKLYKAGDCEKYRYITLIYDFKAKRFFSRLANNADFGDSIRLSFKASIFNTKKDVINKYKKELLYAIREKYEREIDKIQDIYDGLNLINYKGIMFGKIKKHLDYLKEKENLRKIKVIEEEIERLNGKIKKIMAENI